MARRIGAGGGPEAEVGERAAAERDRPHRPRLEAQRPERTGGHEGASGCWTSRTHSSGRCCWS